MATNPTGDVAEVYGPLHNYLIQRHPDVDFIVPGHDDLWPMIEAGHVELAEMEVSQQERELFMLGFGLGAVTAIGLFAFFSTRQRGGYSEPE